MKSQTPIAVRFWQAFILLVLFCGGFAFHDAIQKDNTPALAFCLFITCLNLLIGWRELKRARGKKSDGIGGA